MKIVQTPVTVPIKYGVQINDTIKVFESAVAARAFVSGLEFGGSSLSTSLVTLEIEPLKEK